MTYPKIRNLPDRCTTQRGACRRVRRGVGWRNHAGDRV